MDGSSKSTKTNGSKNSGPLIDVSGSSTDSLPVATISPNAVRSRIGANPANNSAHTSALIGSLVPPINRPSSALPGTVQRTSAISASSPKVSSPPSNVVERHLVRRTYEEQTHTTRQTTVGSRLATDTSPDGSTVGDIASDNFDSLSLQLSPHLSRRAAAISSTVPSTPIRLPISQAQRDLMNLHDGSQDLKLDELSDSALQLQAELKRTLESSNSTFTSLVDLSAPVTKWKRAMSLPQNDFSRAMCHRAVAKSLAQNIRSALRSSPSTIKETLAPGELQAPPHELVPQEQQQPPPQQRFSQQNSEKLISPQISPTIPETQEINNDKSAEDIWVLRDNYIDKLEETDRQWKAQQIVEEQNERRLQTETSRRMGEYVKNRQDGAAAVGGGIDEQGISASVTATRRSSESSNGDAGSNKQHQLSNSSSGNLEPQSSRAYSSGGGNGPQAYSQRGLRNEASGHHRQHHSRGYSQVQMSGEDLSDYSDRDDEPEGGQQPSLLRPFSNFLAGRKGAYSKVPTGSGPDRQQSPRHYSSSQSQSSTSYRAESIQQEERRRSSTDRQMNNSNSNSEQLEAADYANNDVPPPVRRNPEDFDTDDETDKLLEKSYQGQRQIQLPELAEHALSSKPKVSMKEVRLADPEHPSVLLEGVLFRCRYLGSTQLVSDSQPTKPVRMMQAQEAVSRIKAPFGEPQPSTEVDLFISFEKVMVLSTNLQDIIMDHALKTISYVADLDDVVVLMARRRQLPDSNPAGLSASSARGPQLKMLCHVFECEDAHHISDAIGEAFHLAYMSFLRANGIEDPSALREVDNNSEENIGPQDIFNDDLPRFVDKSHQKDIVISKSRGEALGIVVVESGWGSVIPTVVVANMLPAGPAARSGQLNIGDQLLSINGISLVGLPMTSCQSYIKAAKSQTAVRVTLIRCPPVTEVLIKRPDIKYQLGFSVHNGIICSLLRGGIAERGGVRVGHRIIEINGESVVAVSHDRIVNLLSSSVGEIRMKTMPMSIFRLLTGQDVPNYI